MHGVGLFSLLSASLLMIVAAGLSLGLDLGLGRALLVAAARTVVQLLLVGVVLRFVFESRSPLLVGAVVVVMVSTASYEVLSRQERRFTGWWRYGLGSGTMIVATAMVAALALATMRPDPWYEPRIVIPLVGIVLGSVMNGVSISLNIFNDGIVRERVAIEARLALGHARHVALRPLQRRAARSGLIPVINQMSAAGIITLPGMMTGQILAGMSPFEAAEYQIFILLLLASATAAGCFAATRLAAHRATDGRHRLRLDRIAPD